MKRSKKHQSVMKKTKKQIEKEERNMQKKMEKKEYIGELRTEFQEIDKMYEQEKAAEEIISITEGCFGGYTIICC